YVLRVAQEPTTGSAFGTNMLTRLPIAPPLIFELVVTDREGKETSALDEMPFLICQVSLATEEGQMADVLSPIESSNARVSSTGAQRAPTASTSRLPTSPVRMMYGTLVANPQEFSDPSGYPRTYLIFPEISIRARGRFHLRATLMRLPNATTGFTTGSTPLVQATTNTFEVVLSSEYSAPGEQLGFVASCHLIRPESDSTRHRAYRTNPASRTTRRPFLWRYRSINLDCSRRPNTTPFLRCRPYSGRILTALDLPRIATCIASAYTACATSVFYAKSLDTQYLRCRKLSATCLHSRLCILPLYINLCSSVQFYLSNVHRTKIHLSIARFIKGSLISDAALRMTQ
ncbi:hypothetical protein K437DRAFT_230085, partial [Tilletiaria anomala UBC 951]